MILWFKPLGLLLCALSRRHVDFRMMIRVRPVDAQLPPVLGPVEEIPVCPRCGLVTK
jgi:hypothetical protein